VLDQATNDVTAAETEIAEAEANHAAALSGPTKEERAIADAEVQAAAAALAVLEQHLGKTVLRFPVDGIVSVIVAEIGENVHSGQPVLAIAAAGKQWLSFNVREDLLRGLTVGTAVEVAHAGGGARHQPSSLSWNRSGPSPPGRPSARSATTIAIRCDDVAIRKAMRASLSPT
jgi:HlyD family secretion protein